MTWQRSTATWGAGLGLLGAAAWLPGADPLLGAPWILGAGFLALAALVVRVASGRRIALEVAFALTVVLAGLVGARPGASAIVAAVGLSLVVIAYYMFKLEGRIREDEQETTEGKKRTHEAVAFASRRITAVAALSGFTALLLFHVPALTASWVSPRWQVSLDVQSAPMFLAIAVPYLLVVTAWTLMRLGRRGPETPTPQKEGGGSTRAG